MQDIFLDYSLSREEIEKIKTLNLRSVKEEVAESLKSFIESLDREGTLTAKTKDAFVDLLSLWVEDLLSGDYDHEYVERVKRVGEKCAGTSVPLHYVSASVSYLRRVLKDKASDIAKSPDDARNVIGFLDRVLDLSLDLMVSAYREEELKFFLSTGKVERIFIGNLKRFSWFLDVFLIASLVLSSMLIIYWIALEISHIFGGTLPLKEGVLSILGSVLILYALSELINEEIKHLKGAPFSVKTFLGVALAAVIREILILSVSQTDVVKMLSMGAVLLALGLVFWLTTRPQDKTG